MLQAVPFNLEFPRPGEACLNLAGQLLSVAWYFHHIQYQVDVKSGNICMKSEHISSPETEADPLYSEQKKTDYLIPISGIKQAYFQIPAQPLII